MKLVGSLRDSKILGLIHGGTQCGLLRLNRTAYLLMEYVPSESKELIPSYQFGENLWLIC